MDKEYTWGLALILLSITSSFFFLLGFTSPSESQAAYPVEENKVWNEIQAWRQDNGLSLYVWNETACEYANQRLERIKYDWSHDGFEETAMDWQVQHGYYWVGENLAKDFHVTSPLIGWLNSQTHRENLEADFAGGCVVGEEGYYVHVFTK